MYTFAQCQHHGRLSQQSLIVMVLRLQAVLWVETLLVILIYHLHYNPQKILTKQIPSNHLELQHHIHQRILVKRLN